MFDVNFVAVACAAATFMIGGLWYGPLAFGLRWSREAGVLGPNETPKEGARCPKHPGQVFALAFVFSFLAAWTLAWVIGPHATIAHGATTGAVLGAGIAATSFGVNYQFAARSFTMWAIDGGYHTLQLTLAGVVLGAFG
jgi:hypothetical protein